MNREIRQIREWKIYLSGIWRISRFNLGWTTGGDEGNVGRVTGISGGEIRETGGGQLLAFRRIGFCSLPTN
jgi:hypothetical protein